MEDFLLHLQDPTNYCNYLGIGFFELVQDFLHPHDFLFIIFPYEEWDDMDAVLNPASCNMTKGGIRVLKWVAKTHARARWRKGGRKNLYLVRRQFHDYAACKARKAPKTPRAQDGARVGARKH